eukprot:75612-Rhodomonas_salina.1
MEERKRRRDLMSKFAERPLLFLHDATVSLAVDLQVRCCWSADHVCLLASCLRNAGVFEGGVFEKG